MASEVKTNKISPATSTTINVGDSGDTLALAVDDVTGFNVGSDAAGDILYNDGTDYTRLAKPGTPADEVLTFATGASAPSWVAAGGGLSRVDTWIMDTDLTATLTPALLSNWTHSSDSGYSAYSLGNIGAAFAAPSTGVFTFPETGIWQVQTTVQFYPSGGYYNQAFFETYVTDDDGVTWVRAGLQTPYIQDVTSGGGSGISTPLDITDLSNDKIKFQVKETTTSGSAVLVINGSASIPETWVTFVKLGDT